MNKLKREKSLLFIWIVMALFCFTCHECRGISKRHDSVRGGSTLWSWGLVDLNWPYGISMGPILHNPFLPNVNHPFWRGAIAPVTLRLDNPLNQTTFQQQFSSGNSDKFDADTIIFEGDILMKKTPEGMVPSAVHNNILWPGGKIPYIISNEYSQDQKKKIEKAMISIHQKTCIRFTPRTNEGDYIDIKRTSKGCLSYHGKIGGGQELSLDDECFDSDTVKHELMHAIGFYHEHSRTDRDDHVIVHYDNIEFGKGQYFEKKDSTEVQLLNTPYDIKSIMHYRWNAYAVDGTRPTLSDKNGGPRIEPSKDFTETDILDINRLYKCNQGDNSDRFDWYTADYNDNEQLKWARGCDFNGNDYHQVASTAEDCGGHCIADSRCTHFTYGSDVCYLKIAPKSFKASSSHGAVCGYITRRKSGEYTPDEPHPGYHWYPADYNDNEHLKWARGCDFEGNDFREVASSAEDCGGHCIADSRCTHFTYRHWDVCYLKTGPTSFKPSPVQGAVCGYITRRKSGGGSTIEEPHPGYSWYDGESGKVKYTDGCDFPGYDFSCITSWPQHCGGHCIADSRCTHFSYMYQDGPICCLKTAPKSIGVSPHAHGNGGMCGMVLDPDSKLKYPPKPEK